MQDTLGQPELIPVQPESIVQTAGVLAVAYRTDVARIVGIEAQHCAVDGAPSAGPAQQRLLARHLRGRLEERTQLPVEALRQRRELSGRDASASSELRRRDEQRHERSPLCAKCQSCSVTNSPRRSMWTPRTRRESP